MKFYSIAPKSKFILLFLTMTLVNCQKEVVPDLEQEHEHSNDSIENVETNSRRVALQDLLNVDKTFVGLTEEYLSSDMRLNSSIGSRDTQGYVITSDTVNVVERENYKSYTIRIKRPDMEWKYDTENLIIEENDGVMNASILSYKFDNQWVAEYYLGKPSTPKGMVHYTNYGDNNNLFNRGACSYWEIEIIIPCGCRGHYYNCGRCPARYYPREPLVYTFNYESCGGENEGEGPLDGGAPAPGGGAGGGAGGAPGGGPGTVPNIEPVAEFVAFKLVALESYSIIDSTHLDWASNDATKMAKIIALYNYASRTPWTAEAITFATEAANALINNGEVDFEKGLIYNPNLNDFIKSRMSNSEIEIFESLNIIQQTLYLQSAINAYIYVETFFQGPVRNKKGDAMKHTLWNALSSQRLGVELTKSLTDAHEDITYDPDYPNHYKETQMDLYNNAKGRDISDDAFFILVGAYAIHSALNDGELRYLNNLIWSDANRCWIATNSSQLTRTNQ